MKSIEIFQRGKICEVHYRGFVVASGGRVYCKKFAKDLHEKTGDPVFNWKCNNTRVEVQYKVPTKKFDNLPPTCDNTP